MLLRPHQLPSNRLRPCCRHVLFTPYYITAVVLGDVTYTFALSVLSLFDAR